MAIDDPELEPLIKGIWKKSSSVRAGKSRLVGAQV